MKSNAKLKEILELLDDSLSISERFHKKTKYKEKQMKKIKAEIGDPTHWPEEWKKVYFKGYTRLEEYKLPKPNLSSKFSLKESLYNRKSLRDFSDRPFLLEQLGNLLYFSAGLNNNKPPYIINRFYPSDGSRYPLEVYVISLNVKGLGKGLYHYYLKSHSLEKLAIFQNLNIQKYFDQDWLDTAAFIIIITAVFKRTTIKYGDRGYRHVLIESGHLCQNIYLLASVLNISCCAIDGFVDDNLNRLLDIDGLKESVIYTIGGGLKK